MPNPSACRKLGRNLARLRNEAGFTQAQLAESADLSYRYLQELEGGVKVPSLLSVIKLAKALKATSTVLLDGVDDLIPFTPAIPAGISPAKKTKPARGKRV